MSLPFPANISTSRKPCIPSSLPTSTAFNQTPLFPHPTEDCFADIYGRTILLRGLNVGGCSKAPEILSTSQNGQEVASYNGRPFKNIEEAGEWWAKLKMWGVGIVRWVVVWEAIEPKAIGDYDDEYIDYLYKVLEKAGENGLKVFIDVHQDCWSRLSGGSGAPAWTFSLVGLDPHKFHATFTSALLPSDTQQSNSFESAEYIFSEPDLPVQQTPLSKPSSHLWPTNYSKLSTATMFTMFFAGPTFAPKATISIPGKGEKNAGEVMQDAYINAFRYVARKLAGLECILGWDIMNEPHPGFIGLKSLAYWNQDTELHLGVMPNGVQGMVLASGGDGAPHTGLKVKLAVYHRSWPRPSIVTEYVDYDLTKGHRVWADRRKDIWMDEGVWWWDKLNKNGYSCKADYFTKNPKTGAPIDFERDFYEPFLQRFLAAVREGRQQGLNDLGLPQGGGMGQWCFIEPVPNIGPPLWVDGDEVDIDKTASAGGFGVCYAPHWYDLRACFEKRLSYTLSFDIGALALGSRNFFQHSYFGRLGLLENYMSQFTRLVSRLPSFRKSGKPTPVLVGETGIPFDINGFEAYKTGNVHWQMVMLDSIIGAMERVGKGNLNWTLWNFTSENYVTFDPRTETLESGDGWNSEDFSLISRDQAMTEVTYSPQQAKHQSYRMTSIRPHNRGVYLQRAKALGDLYAGARCIGAWIRPYPAKVAGILVKSQFTLANVDAGTRECWGGTFQMSYIANCGDGGRTNSKLARTTEIFMPAYHFGGETWVLQISAYKSRCGLPLVTILITSEETDGIVDVNFVAGGAVTWSYSEASQSVSLLHTPQLTGYTIQVSAEVGVPTQKERGLFKQCFIILAWGIIGIVLAFIIAAWYTTEELEMRRMEFIERRY
ncbi:glycoside hydrolase [Terfezia boudieri ATCC MYA-4762]|uniref:Glycoside hydrolase n=1 Tax=Terfezia boudieri ATCC MYA-4762 TaxID=1051890 RepID=A0A3N4LQH4_9PEZI|nr:glycoside hydrolase [Terfezia boudieri ATCC MYA-4762]